MFYEDDFCAMSDEEFWYWNELSQLYIAQST